MTNETTSPPDTEWKTTALVVLVIAAVFSLAYGLDALFIGTGGNSEDVSRGLSQFRQTCSTEPTWAIRFNADGSSTFVATCTLARK